MSQAKELMRSVTRWLLPEPPGDTAATVQNAQALLERVRPSALLKYRGYDHPNDLVMLDDEGDLYAGFGFLTTPLIVGGRDMEDPIEGIINSLPEDSTFMTAIWSSDDITDWMNQWKDARLKYCENDLLREMIQSRYEYVMNARLDDTLVPGERFHPRDVRSYVFVRVPYRGSVESPIELDQWVETMCELRESISGRLTSSMMNPRRMDQADFKRIVRQLLNPQVSMDELDARESKDKEFPEDLVLKDTRIRVDETGKVSFTGGTRDVLCTPITIDAYPEYMSLPHLRNLTGALTDREDRISDPHWIYTIVHVPNPDETKDRMTQRLGNINRQALSESAWFRSMASHLFERKAETEALLKATRSRRQIVRVMSGINIYTKPERATSVAEYVCSLWRKSGFQASIEKNIGLPIFFSSLPLQYDPKADEPNKGFMRMEMVNSLNAACMSFVAADWGGMPPHKAGPLFFSRRGRLAAFDLFSSETNYNLSVIANSGAGKSFVANEVVTDVLARGGIVRIIDVGRSYMKLCDVLGGNNLIFNPREPKSINPFSGIKDRVELDEMMPLLKDTVAIMAYPRTDHVVPAWEYQFIEQAIFRSWQEHGENLGMAHICEFLAEQEDPRAQDLATQLESYGTGRYQKWFNGPKEVGFYGAMCVLELEELNQDSNFRAIILIIAMNMIMRDIYLTDAKNPDGSRKPALLLVDEAWDLLGSDGDGSTNSSATAKFIETASRRIRKYFGSLVVISQAYGDLLKSSAAKAALVNSAWRFSLQQSAASMKDAREGGALPTDNGVLWRVLPTVRKSDGYSEVHVINDGSANDVFRFIVDPLSLFTFTTNPTDKAMIEQIREQHNLSYKDAINQLAEAKKTHNRKINAA